MTDLIACLFTAKGTWGHVSKVIEGQAWSRVILVANKLAKEFTSEKPTQLVIIDEKQPITSIIQQLTTEFKENVADTEVAVNLASGSGKEHMAILSAVMKAGLSFRLVALTIEGVKEI